MTTELQKAKELMKLFLISQNVNTAYDTYSDAVVCAENEEEAKKIHPNGDYDYKEHSRPNPYAREGEFEKADEDYGTWSKKEYVQVKYIGEADITMKKGVICASFHAG